MMRNSTIQSDKESQVPPSKWKLMLPIFALISSQHTSNLVPDDDYTDGVPQSGTKIFYLKDNPVDIETLKRLVKKSKLD